MVERPRRDWGGTGVGSRLSGGETTAGLGWDWGGVPAESWRDHGGTAVGSRHFKEFQLRILPFNLSLVYIEGVEMN